MAFVYDVAIIGGGPAGSSCALALHKKGLKVVLIDKASFPRDKTCGDAIPGPSFKAFASLNENWHQQLKTFKEKMEVTSALLVLGNKNSFQYNWKTYSYNSKRIDFDHFLYQLVQKETDTTTFTNKQLKNIIDETTHYRCEFQDDSTLLATMVIGCDGANSIVRKKIMQGSTHKNIAAVRAYYKNIAGMKEGVNEIHVLKEVKGYFWIFPLKDGWANVGFGLFNNKTKKASTVNVTDILQKITHSPSLSRRFKDAVLVDRVKGHGLPIWTKKTPISGNRFMLCGDAAYLIDPLQGHGIDNAIWSGIIAANQICNCFKKQNFSAKFMTQYDQRIYHQLGRIMSGNYRVMRIAATIQKIEKFVPFSLFPNQKILNWLIKKIA